MKSAATADGLLSFAEYMQTVLYAPGCGYYRRDRERVGRTHTADFYTATSLGNVFGQLVVAAATTLLGKENPGDFTFVEIGAEPGGSVIDGVPHPFKAVEVIRVGDRLSIPAKAVVFANELLDAQPFHRVRFQEGKWQELGVHLHIDELTGAYTITEALLRQPTAEVGALLPTLPALMPEGYTLDISLGAEKLLHEIFTGAWQGVVILCDYGKMENDLLAAFPEGTLRAYHKQQQSNNLYANPGEQDLTGHVCWDRLETTLRAAGFSQTGLDRQEAFFMQNSRDALASIIEAAASPTANNQRQRLRELLHPAYLGTKFQVLWGRKCPE